MPAVAWVRAIVPAFHALQDTRTPVIAAALSVCVYLGAALFLMPNMQHAGLALATSLAAYFQFFALLILLRLRHTGIALSKFISSALRTITAATLVIGPLFFVQNWIDLHTESTWQNAAKLAAQLVASGVLYLALLWILRSAEARTLISAVAKRVGRE